MVEADTGRPCCCLDVVMTSDVRTAFSGVDVVIMMAKVDRKANVDRREYLKNVVRISRQHAAAVDKYAKKTVKVSSQDSDIRYLSTSLQASLWLRGIVVERRSLAGELSLSCA